MKDALARMFSSAKVWTVIIGGLVTAGASFLAKYGLEVSDATVQQIAGTAALLVGILVHAQGQADHGKYAVRAVDSNTATPAAPVAETPAAATTETPAAPTA
jgi:hypothetical protein